VIASIVKQCLQGKIATSSFSWKSSWKIGQLELILVRELNLTILIILPEGSSRTDLYLFLSVEKLFSRIVLIIELSES
jgi:hypothetical protein